MLKSLGRPVLAAALAIGVTGFAANLASAENWKCYTYMPAPAHPVVVGISNVAKSLEEITNGRIHAECHVGGSLPIDAYSITGALTDGVLDIAANGFVSGVIPIGGMLLLPGLFDTREEMDKGYEILEPLLQKEFADRGIVLLSKYYFPEQVLWAKGDITSLKDLEGKTIRVQNTEQAAFAEAVGGVPVTLAAADVPPALQRGTVQVVITAAAGGGKLWRDEFDHVLLVSTNYSIDWMQISKARWDELSPEEQKALKASAEEQAAWVNNTMRDQTGELLKEFAEKDKMVVTEPSAEDRAFMAKASEPIWEAWAEKTGPEAAEALKKVREALGK